MTLEYAERQKQKQKLVWLQRNENVNVGKRMQKYLLVIVGDVNTITVVNIDSPLVFVL